MLNERNRQLISHTILIYYVFNSRFVQIDAIAVSSKHRFRDRRRFQSKIAKFSHPVYFTPPLTGSPLELDIGARVQKSAITGLPDGRKKFKKGLDV